MAPPPAWLVNTGETGSAFPTRARGLASRSSWAQLAGTHKPGTVQLYLISLRLLPPPAEHWRHSSRRSVPSGGCCFVTIEQGGLRLGEAVNLHSATKRDSARWVYLPDWLVDAIEATCPLEDRVAERRVFQGITEASAYQAMLRACKNAKIRTTRRTISGTGGSRSGISPASRLGSSPSVPVMHNRR
jgi:integrase